MATHDLDKLQDAIDTIARLNNDDVMRFTVHRGEYEAPIAHEDRGEWHFVGLTNLEFLIDLGYLKR